MESSIKPGEATSQYTAVGIDLAKHVSAVHAVTLMSRNESAARAVPVTPPDTPSHWIDDTRRGDPDHDVPSHVSTPTAPYDGRQGPVAVWPVKKENPSTRLREVPVSAHAALANPVQSSEAVK